MGSVEGHMSTRLGLSVQHLKSKRTLAKQRYQTMVMCPPALWVPHD